MDLDGQRIRSLLREVAEHLAPTGPQHVVILAGGSLLACQGLRSSTRDVDSLRHVDPELAAAVTEVAQIHGLSPRWLNHQAAMFTPATLLASDCPTLANHPRLLVLGTPLDQVFLMKLYAARDRDLDDLRILWPVTSFTTGTQAAKAFWEAYPHAPEDPYLASFIADLAP